MKASFHAGGLLSPAGFARWRAATRREIRNATRDAMREVGPQMVEDVRRDMRHTFTVRRQGFLKSMRAPVYRAKGDRPPALVIGLQIDWLGIHTSGGTVAGAGAGKTMRIRRQCPRRHPTYRLRRGREKRGRWRGNESLNRWIPRQALQHSPTSPAPRVSVGNRSRPTSAGGCCPTSGAERIGPASRASLRLGGVR